MFSLLRLSYIIFCLLRFQPHRALFNQKNTQSLIQFFLHLGPLFIKLGQVLSTRPDIITPEASDALSHLQDRVPPTQFDEIKKSIPTHILSALTDIDPEPIGSGSIAQVHAAKYQDKDIVIKILRPEVPAQIKKDLKALRLLSKILLIFLGPFRKIQIGQFIAEFEYSLMLEINLKNESANLQSMQINFKDDDRLYIPQVFHQLCDKNILCLEKIKGIKISEIPTLYPNTNLKMLAENGVKIFFTQVLRDRFFHADMHPGNIFVDIQDPNTPKYMAIDFGIVGSLSLEDTYYLGANFRAFFHRNYHEIARLHLESGWIKGHIRIDHFEQAIRSVCDPIYAKPIHEISFAQVLGKLIEIAQKFELVAQPQLLLLQKTLLNVEGLGRQIYPQLNLWDTAKPLVDEFYNPLKRLPQSLAHLPSLTATLEQSMYHALFPIPKKSEPKTNKTTWALSLSILLNITLCFYLFLSYY
jgi:ubiquinone biosynthesis protein